MKKIILISLALLFSTNLKPQDLPPDGKFIMKHKNGETYLTGEVKNNEKHGTWEFFYESGQLQARENTMKEDPLVCGRLLARMEGFWSKMISEVLIRGI